MKRSFGNIPASLGDALNRLIQTKGIARPQANAQLVDAWKNVVEERIAEHTRVFGLHRGMLQVGVFSASLLHELVSFHQSMIEAELAEKYPDLHIQGVKFKLRSDLRSTSK
ncbi:DciA family protein [Calycomorphotria hydatis]|uniref:DUF721 domain-containing protein n=1 Tax=Calycomorphotria hydatis TaxID=2528027 RepID=A0A517T3A0_9PLAN|nr:DUF721 domain-containing protein [Calycomorphotria hydatis]QDT62811.1 hypothetical protein V22_00090 [Calycomorphotria hydatis]